MNSLFSNLTLSDVHEDLIRNIVSIRESQDLYDDLSDDPNEWEMAQNLEDDVKPPPYGSHPTVIHRPFEDSDWFNAIQWPFEKWQESRFSDGSFGVWYGSKTIETTVFESAYHWFKGLLCDAGFEAEPVTIERKVYAVTCDAALLDLRKLRAEHRDILHPSDYSFSHTVGQRIHREGHPGLRVKSVRDPEGENFAIFNPKVLRDPKVQCLLTYRLTKNAIVIERSIGDTWMTLSEEILDSWS
jgi:hypothetical protein